MSSDELLELKGSLSDEGASVELALSKDVPGVLARVFPKFAAKSRARTLLSSLVLEKVQKGQPLDSADIPYVIATFGKAEANWIRMREIAMRAAKAIEEEKRILALLPSPEPSAKPAATADDWISKFWEDAGLVSDEVLQEVYGRILAAEATTPGTCSLRTLQVLRYMDRSTAESFAELVPAAFDWGWVPRDESLHHVLGISYELLMDLDDAGLVDSNPNIVLSVTSSAYVPRYGTLALFMENAAGLEISEYPLTRAGKELARVAQIHRRDEHFFAVARWLQSRKADMRMRWARVPTPTWNGDVDTLTWAPLPVESPNSASAPAVFTADPAKSSS
jgi:hypothetical protein